MVRVLIKKQLLELWQSYLINGRTGKARSKKGIALFTGLLVLLFGGLGLAFFIMANALGSAILNNGINWLYFALMGILTIALGVFGSVFNTYAALYLPKDNELLLSLPIPGDQLLIARLASVYTTGLMYSAWIWIPVMIAYWVLVPVTVCRVIFPILLTFVISLFVTILSCILGWIVAVISVKAKGKSFLRLLTSLAVIGVYYAFYFKVAGSLSDIVNHLGTLEATVKSWLHYSYCLGLAADGNVLAMLLITVITALLAGLCFVVLSKTFLRLSFAGDKTEQKKLRPDEYRQVSAGKALLNREYKHFTSISTWMLNGGFGLLVLPAATVAMVIKGGTIREILLAIELIPELFSALPVFLLAAACLVLSAVAILPVSVSLEGKSLWILQSLPIEPWDALHAKEKMNVQLSVVPAFLFVIVSGAVLKMKSWNITLVCCAVLLYIWILADFGLFLNLMHPNFNWTNVATVTKQSLSVVISMFGGWFFCAVFGVGGYFLCRWIPTTAVLALYVVLFFLVWQLLRHWLKTKGTEIFCTL